MDGSREVNDHIEPRKCAQVHVNGEWVDLPGVQSIEFETTELEDAEPVRTDLSWSCTLDLRPVDPAAAGAAFAAMVENGWAAHRRRNRWRPKYWLHCAGLVYSPTLHIVTGRDFGAWRRRKANP